MLKVHGAPECRGPEFQAKKLCTWVKRLTDLQILGCELHKNAFGGRALPGPAAGAIALPRPPSCYKGQEREGRQRKELGIRRR